MSSCPNINLAEWKALESAVGKFEAYRDYLETGGEIRTPGEVEYKMAARDVTEQMRSSLGESPSFAEMYQEINAEKQARFGMKLSQLKNGRANELANKLSLALGIDYGSVTAEEAMLLTKNSKNPWSGEAAFFVGGKVYFLQDRMSSDMVLHEFSHPLVRAISKENPELFNSLYEGIVATEAGKSIYNDVKENYTALEADSDLFKEEVIVKALEKAASQKLSEEKLDTGFRNAVNEILFNFKQWLRRIFGKGIKISKLDVDTTLDELADILTAGNVIKIDTELVSQEDIVAYNKEAYDDVTRDLDKVRNKDVQDNINNFYDVISTHLGTLIKNENYEELAELLTDEYLRGDYQAIRSNLSKYQTTIMDAAERLQEDMNDSRTRVEALTNSLFRLEDVMEKILEHMLDVSNRTDTQENLHKAYYYDKFIKNWVDFIDEMEKMLDDPRNNISGRSPARALITDIKTNLTKSKKLIDEMYADGARDALYEQLEPLNRSIADRYESMLEVLRAKPQTEARDRKIDSIYKEYHGMNKEQYSKFQSLLALQKKGSLSLAQEAELKSLGALSQKGLSISKDKIELLLKGQIGDANWFNSYLEGYLYNTDPVVGGLALYTKNALNEVMIVSQRKFNEFAEDIRDDLKAAGYNPTKIGELGEDIGFLDKIAKKNPDTGQMEESTVWTFLHQFKDYRYDKAEYLKRVSDAQLEYQINTNEDNRLVLLTAVAEHKKFLRTYFHQEYVDEFYDRQELFEKDDIGKEAAYAREEIMERMRKLQEPNKSQTDEIAIGGELDSLWREYSQLFSRYDLNGQLKEGKDAEMAKRLRDYREASREFYEWKPRKGVFENKYFDFQQELRSQEIEENGPEWVLRMDEWKSRNTRKVIKDEFYTRRTEIIEEIKVIMDKIGDPDSRERKEVDQAAVWSEIIDLVGGFRDADGQPIGSEMAPGSIDSVRDLQMRLEEIKEASIQRSGLTKEQGAKLSDFVARNKEGQLNNEEVLEMQQLFALREERGLSKADSATLNSLYAELGELSYKEPTKYYMDIVNNYLSKVDTTELKKYSKSGSIDETTAALLMNPNIVEKLFEQDPQFEEWFTSNHLMKEVFNKDTQKTEFKYERLYMWNVVKPTDSSMMESYEILDSDGVVVDTIEGLPSMSYSARVVKLKYRNRSIEGVTKDNQGQWLPKTRAEMSKNTELSEEDKYKYINKEYEAMAAAPEGTKEAAQFKLLEKLKKHHMQNQEGLAYSSRLGYDMPRYRKESLETIQSMSLKKGKAKVNALTLLAKRFKDFFRKTEDQMEDGLNQEQKFNLVRADMFDNEMTDIPISGLYDIDYQDVSTDITLSMMRYMMSGERQKQLVKISPIVRAIQATVNNPENAVIDLNNVNKKEFENRSLLRYLPKKKNVRKQAVNNFIEKNFEGKNMTGLGSETAWLNNFANLLFKRASFSFFALNVPSALKNSMGMKFQSMIEASGGQYVDHVSLQKGNGWAYVAMGEMSFSGELYKRGAKTHRMQMMEIWDPVQGRFEEKFGESISRTVASDAANFSWLYSFRKWVEIQAGVQLWAGMMYKKKIMMGDKEIPYMDAFETVDKQIRLKKGIDVRYGSEPVIHSIQATDTLESIAAANYTTVEVIEEALKGKNLEDILDDVQELEYDRNLELSDVDINSAQDPMERTKLQDRVDAINNKYDRKTADAGSIKINNSEFKFMKNQMQQVQNNMGGAYAKFDQPEAQRYLAFRFISYLRRYFTTMATNRWGFSGPLTDPRPRLNPGLGDVQMGFYIEFGKFIAQTIKSGGQEIKYMTPSEKTATLKMVAEVGMLMLTTALMSLLFGWDPEDEDRYAKLRARSGAAGFLGLTGDNKEGNEFNLLGYMELHSLQLLMQVRAENEQFNLLTGGIAQYNSLLDIKSVALGPTTDSYVKLWDDWKKIMTGDPKAYYTRDVGPYKWQEQGGSKFTNHFLKTFGMTGSSLDPALAIQNFQSYQAKVR